MSAAEAVVQKLLGCAWGRGISTPDDTTPCPERAKQIVVLHRDDEEYEVRLCERHLAVVLEQSTPRPMPDE